MADDIETFVLPGYDTGLRCEHCDTVLQGVDRTNEREGLVMRERVCPNCKRINETVERVLTSRQPRRYTRRDTMPRDDL